MFDVRCLQCGKVLELRFRMFCEVMEQLRERAAEEDISPSKLSDMVAGALDHVGAHRICCRTQMLTHVDDTDETMAITGDLYRRTDEDRVCTAGELAGTVHIYRGPEGGKRKIPTTLIAR